VLARNVRTRQGEIDVIAFDGRTLVFAEVKTRRAGARQRSIRPDQESLPARTGAPARVCAGSRPRGFGASEASGRQRKTSALARSA